MCEFEFGGGGGSSAPAGLSTPIRILAPSSLLLTLLPLPLPPPPPFQVAIPDLHPGNCGVSSDHLSMCAGDFMEVYGDPKQVGEWDSVVTCFFIDTAHNVLDYLTVIARCLREGGFWINHGPLQYHWADSHLYLPGGELSIELPLEAIERAAPAFGLRLVRREERVCTYTNNRRSMQQNTYRTAFHCMVKDSALITPEMKARIYGGRPGPTNAAA